MADGNPPPTGSTAIPDDVQKQFPELLALIKASESMNDEERQYWINILPIMTPDQVQSLREILDNEKKQLAAIDEKYRADASPLPVTSDPQTEVDRRKRREDRTSKEQSHKQEEEKATEELLRSIEDPGATK